MEERKPTQESITARIDVEGQRCLPNRSQDGRVRHHGSLGRARASRRELDGRRLVGSDLRGALHPSSKTIPVQLPRRRHLIRSRVHEVGMGEDHCAPGHAAQGGDLLRERLSIADSYVERDGDQRAAPHPHAERPRRPRRIVRPEDPDPISGPDAQRLQPRGRSRSPPVQRREGHVFRSVLPMESDAPRPLCRFLERFGKGAGERAIRSCRAAWHRRRKRGPRCWRSSPARARGPRTRR